MSTIWTPRGEHEVPRQPGGPAASDHERPEGPPTDEGAGDSAIDPADAEAMAKEMAEAQARIREAPVEQLVANHVVGLYELAAVHLSAEHPNFEAARLAIDAMGHLVEGLGDRLPERQTLTDALHQLRLAFVDLKNRHDA